MAARRLGVSVATIRRYEGSRLHPRQGEDGVWRFNPEEVDALADQPRSHRSAPRDEGQAAARAFFLFGRGRDLREIVIDTKLHPRVVRELYAEWLVDLQTGEERRRSRAADLEWERDREQRDRAWQERERIHRHD